MCNGGSGGRGSLESFILYAFHDVNLLLNFCMYPKGCLRRRSRRLLHAKRDQPPHRKGTVVGLSSNFFSVQGRDGAHPRTMVVVQRKLVVSGPELVSELLGMVVQSCRGH